MEVFRLDLSLIQNRPDLLSAYRDLLSTDEKEKYVCLSSEKRQLEFLGGHALIHDVIGMTTNQAPKQVKVVIKDGVPLLADIPLFVSVSHSGGLVTVAVDEQPVGLDIERSFARRNLSALVEECFSSEAAHTYNLLKPSERRAFFFRLWTMKEAGVKWQSLSDLKDNPNATPSSVFGKRELPKLHFFSGQIDDMFFSVVSAKPLVSVPFIAKVPLEPHELILTPTETLLV